jgi:23S rRNA (adenine2503-C2)-methyltransferase
VKKAKYPFFGMKHRVELFREAWPRAERFRERQFFGALFSGHLSSWDEVSVFAKPIRERFAQSVPWILWRETVVRESENGDTYKALLESIEDSARIETVLMKNTRGHFTVCVSSQVGCAMKCAFCATGALGFMRNLSDDEIVDQVRFWKDFLKNRGMDGDITNVVYMGMGEPLANDLEVRSSLRMLIEYGGIGVTRITVSTVGLIPKLKALLNDPQWPSVRIAISLHSADEALRKTLMPTSYEGFLRDLSDWVYAYHKTFGERRRHITFEYVLLGGVNDTEYYANLLAKFVNRLRFVKVNIIPWNEANDGFYPSSLGEEFVQKLKSRGVVTTIRRSRGADIAAACGQLANRRS